MDSKLAALLLLGSLLFLSPAVDATDGTASVTSRSDDAEEDTATGEMYLDSSDLEFCTGARANEHIHTHTHAHTTCVRKPVAQMPPTTLDTDAHVTAPTHAVTCVWPNKHQQHMRTTQRFIRADGADQIVGVRFLNVAIPTGATVSAATIVFDTDEVHEGQSDQPIHVLVRGELSTHSAPFADADYDISTRSTTQAHVTWSPASSVATHDAFSTSVRPRSLKA